MQVIQKVLTLYFILVMTYTIFAFFSIRLISTFEYSLQDNVGQI